MTGNSVVIGGGSLVGSALDWDTLAGDTGASTASLGGGKSAGAVADGLAGVGVVVVVVVGVADATSDVVSACVAAPPKANAAIAVPSTAAWTTIIRVRIIGRIVPNLLRLHNVRAGETKHR